MKVEAPWGRTVLVVGATGSIGRLVVAEAIQNGMSVRALVRTPHSSKTLHENAEIVVGDVTRPETLAEAVRDVGAIVFTLGTDGLGVAGAEAVNYGSVRNILRTLTSTQVRLVLMTAIGVTVRGGDFPWPTGVHDWKRRAERLVRASGQPFTIIRPGWFDLHAADQQRLVLLQGDTRRRGDPSDGVISRRQIAELIVASLVSKHAAGKTFELVAETGPPQDDISALFERLEGDPIGGIDGVQDVANIPFDREPQAVRDDLEALSAKLPWRPCPLT